ncbi:sigma factor [Micromonospora sp. NPDC050686]|uniref:sigma factor n=1 Tax=Micromonospora sp. NPDC050686 TaxID=3154631 RepID=UPI0033FAF87F
MDEDERARLAEFVTGRTPALMQVAYLLTGDRHAAEDLLQSALAKTIPRWRTLRHADPEGYLRTPRRRATAGPETVRSESRQPSVPPARQDR